jgi:hypothetical protein
LYLSQPSDVDSTVGYVYLLGGDTYVGDGNSRNVLVSQGWEKGYKNDVWKMTGTEWFTIGDHRLRSQYHQKLPQVNSLMRWDIVTSGLIPPVETTYDEWIRCQDFFRNVPVCALGVLTSNHFEYTSPIYVCR